MLLTLVTLNKAVSPSYRTVYAIIAGLDPALRTVAHIGATAN